MKIIIVILTTSFILFPFSAAQAQQAGDWKWGIDVHYPIATEQFTSALTEAGQEIQNPEEIETWARDTTDRLPEFLVDMLRAAKSFEDQGINEFDLTAINGFVK